MRRPLKRLWAAASRISSQTLKQTAKRMIEFLKTEQVRKGDLPAADQREEQQVSSSRKQVLKEPGVIGPGQRWLVHTDVGIRA